MKRKRESAPIMEAPERMKAPAKAIASKPKAEPAIVLASHCSVKDAAALKDSLCKAASQRGAVTLDVRSLERIDTATIQLLCAFVRDCNAREQRVEWLGASAALGEAARLLGVGAMLALPANASAGATA